MDRSYVRRMARIKNLLEGMALLGDKLEKWGISQELMNKITMLYNQATINEQKKKILKDSARQLTAAQNQLLKDLESYCTLVREWVRFEFPQETWPEFGFRKGEYAVKRTAGGRA